jgi:hypothetical protein
MLLPHGRRVRDAPDVDRRAAGAGHTEHVVPESRWGHGENVLFAVAGTSTVYQLLLSVHVREREGMGQGEGERERAGGRQQVSCGKIIEDAVRLGAVQYVDGAAHLLPSCIASCISLADTSTSSFSCACMCVCVCVSAVQKAGDA